MRGLHANAAAVSERPRRLSRLVMTEPYFPKVEHMLLHSASGEWSLQLPVPRREAQTRPLKPGTSIWHRLPDFGPPIAMTLASQESLWNALTCAGLAPPFRRSQSLSI